MKILIAEDESTMSLVLVRMLERLGHKVCAASDGEEAWNILQAETFSVVILDWMMPGLDGPSLCRLIREREEGDYLYTILLTSLTGRGNRMEGLWAGADDFLVKPVDPEELNARLEIARRILGVHARLQEQNERLLELATVDGLTTLKNRRAFRQALEVNFSLARRSGLPLSLVMLDVDHFKSFNDTFGHPAGDEALKTIASILKRCCREHDMAARLGGEEFALLLLGAGALDAVTVARRVQASLASASWPCRPITASFGIATIDAEMDDPASLIERADEALYRSKRDGRDRISSFGVQEAIVGPVADLVG